MTPTNLRELIKAISVVDENNCWERKIGKGMFSSPAQIMIEDQEYDALDVAIHVAYPTISLESLLKTKNRVAQCANSELALCRINPAYCINPTHVKLMEDNFVRLAEIFLDTKLQMDEAMRDEIKKEMQVYVRRVMSNLHSERDLEKLLELKVLAAMCRYFLD